MKAPQILYFAHDLDDTAIWRRVEMLKAGGARVRVVGFRRGDGPLPQTDAVVLGRTENGRMVQRAAMVLGQSLRMRKWVRDQKFEGEDVPDIVLARNLEMLLIARAACRFLPSKPRLVYELLDIHRLQSADNRIGKVVRAIERWALRGCDLVLISSPGFRTNYLERWDMAAPADLLIENKVFISSNQTEPTVAATKQQHEKITIGWFGILRCAWSLRTLDRLSRQNPGHYSIILRGKPALDQIPDFHSVIDANPDIVFGGPYGWPDDLADIYKSCDLAWLIDRFDDTGNSRWLLPNRLYEGCLFGAIPIVTANSEVGRRLDGLGCGIIVDDETDDAVQNALAALTMDGVTQAQARVAAQPERLWKVGTAECKALVMRLADSHARNV